MTSNDPDKLISIGEVVDQLKAHTPSITHSSLRFFEREGLVTPLRTAGGHRLYSRQDIDRILLIKSWQARRLTIEEIRNRLASIQDSEAVATSVHRSLLAGDFDRTRALLLEADDAGMPLARLFEAVLEPALKEVGERWHAGALSITEEKEITEFAREAIVLLSLRHRRVEANAAVALAACVAGERHEIGLRMITGLLGARGWQSVFLGPDIEAPFLIEAIVRHRPSLVLLSAAMPERLEALKGAVHSIRTESDSLRILVGGRAISAHQREIRSWGAIPIVDETLETTIADIIAQAPQT